MGNLITAYCAGRKNGNTEVYIKEALMAAKEMGCDVELIRLCECDLQVCRCCKRQVCGIKGKDACPIGGDDTWWLVEKFLDSDGYLIGAPVWSLGPPGNVTVFRDRIMGPKMDRSAYDLFGEPSFIKGRNYSRPGALISVGGAGTEHWTALGLPTLYTTVFSAKTDVIDHMNVTGVADIGSATFYEHYLDRARQLGKNLAHAVLHHEEPHRWMGKPDEGLCPGCHLNYMIMVPNSNEIICQICGIHGTMKIENGKFAGIDWVENDPDDRLTMEGSITHGKEVMGIIKNEYMPRKDEVPALMKKYDDLNHIVVTPPSKQK